MESRIHIPSAPLSTFLWNSQAAVPFKKLPTLLNGPRWVGRRAVGRDWKLWSVTKSSTGDLFQSQREVRDHSLHLTFLYLPSHPPIKKTGKPKYLPLGLGPQADTKGMELLHRAPELSLWLALPLLLRAPGRALQVLLQKRLLLELQDCPLPASEVSGAFQLGIRPGERARRSPLTAARSPSYPQLGPFLWHHRFCDGILRKDPRRLASCFLPNLARKCRDRGRGAGWLALFTEGMDDRECGVAAHRKAGDREFGVDSIDRSGV